MRLKNSPYCLHLAALFLCFLSFTIDLSAQYFGRNKVLYKNFDFKVTRTPHFDIYNYLQNNTVKNRFAQLTEQWYSMHQSVFRDTFRERNPLIVYNHHADFQQTRAIEGQIDVGTGGVTEALKNRVVLPFMESNAQTDHVLGHELVHAFQYHLILDSMSLSALENLPLWMVEGLAEYMSTGYKDANTAMWLRSAVANNKLPTLKDLTNRPDLYFPYRWGEAFWAYVTGFYGDTVIRRLFIETAKRGYNDAMKRVLHIDEKTFSKQWQEAIRTAYAPYQVNTQAPVGQNLIGKKNAGDLNIVPSISPDGKYIAFWTEKNLFSLDLYLADAATGKIIDRVTTASFNSHIEQYSSYESSVAWSPDSRQLAFVAFAKGHNRLLIANSDNGKIKQEIDIPGVSGFSNPAWSPDGNTIVVTGLVNGQSDLYAYNLNTKTVKQLTNDIYSDFLPSYSPDGKWIAFATDRLALGNTTMIHDYSHNIALYNTQTGAVTNLDFFRGANNLNPVFAPDNKTLYFLSDRDGLRNLYSYNLDTKEILQRTNLFSGISGITMYAPAISVSQKTDQIVYSYYNNSDYLIYSAPAAAFLSQPVNATDVNMQAAVMPPFTRHSVDLVQRNMEQPVALTAAQTKTTDVPYDPKFQLDYLGNTGGVGVQTGGVYGTGLSGGVNGIFSDMLGNHQLFGALSLNGEIVDVAGQFAYINQKHRFNWGGSVSHVPYLSGAQYLFYDTIKLRNGDTAQVLNSSLDLLRTFQDQVAVFGSYPFSAVQRIEAGASFSRYYYRLDRYSDYYDPTGTVYVGSAKEKQDVPSGFNLSQAYVALVGDNSFFGVASPLQGSRYRLEAGQYIGAIKMSTLTGDYRKYFRFAPITFATRNMFMGRYGPDAESGLLPPLFLGYPELVRGYNALNYAEDGAGSLSINDLIGSKIYVGNAELRYPLTGPERLSGIKSRFFFSELNLFTDAGVAWGSTGFISNPNSPKETTINRTSKFIMSSGISLRVNVFGYLIVEPYYAIPWQNGGWKNRTFGVNIIPGW